MVDLDTIEQIYEDHFLQKRLSPGYTRIGDDQAVERRRLSIGLSAAPGVVPFTKAKGKNGAGTSSSVVIAGVGMGVKYAPVGELPDEYLAGVVCDAGEWAAPGPVSASVRLQYLFVSADLYPTVDEVVTDCVLNDGGTPEDPTDDTVDCMTEALEIEGDVTLRSVWRPQRHTTSTSSRLIPASAVPGSRGGFPKGCSSESMPPEQTGGADGQSD